MGGDRNGGHIRYIFPHRSQLIFTDDEKNPLAVQRLNHLEISTRLVVFSAYFTANSGVDNLQDEFMQFALSVFDAGSRAVVGLLWSVERNLEGYGWKSFISI